MATRPPLRERAPLAVLILSVSTAACSPGGPSPLRSALSVWELREVVCSDFVEQDSWVVGPVVVTASRSRDSQEVEGRFAVQDPGGGEETGLWVEAPEGVLVEALGLRTGQVVYLEVQAEPGYPGCGSLDARLLSGGLVGTGRWAEPVATWDHVNGGFWNRAGELVELQGELQTRWCPSCWGAARINTEDYEMEIRGSMVQIPSRKEMVLRNLVGIASTMRTGMIPEDFALSLHPRGADDLQIVEEGVDCSSTMAEAADTRSSSLRITGASIRLEGGWTVLVDGEHEVDVYDSSHKWCPACGGPVESGPIDIAGKIGSGELWIDYGPAWCNDSNAPTITDALEY